MAGNPITEKAPRIAARRFEAIAEWDQGATAE
jgi:hypothetical protein